MFTVALHERIIDYLSLIDSSHHLVLNSVIIIELYFILLTGIQTFNDTNLKFISREPLLRACTKDINTPCFQVDKYKKRGNHVFIKTHLWLRFLSLRHINKSCLRDFLLNKA